MRQPAPTWDNSVRKAIRQDFLPFDTSTMRTMEPLEQLPISPLPVLDAASMLPTPAAPASPAVASGEEKESKENGSGSASNEGTSACLIIAGGPTLMTQSISYTPTHHTIHDNS